MILLISGIFFCLVYYIFIPVLKDIIQENLKYWIKNNPIIILYTFLIIFFVYRHFIFSLILTIIFLLIFCYLYLFPKIKDKLIKKPWITIIQIVLYGIFVFGDISYRNREFQRNQVLEVYFMLPPKTEIDADKNNVEDHKHEIFEKFKEIFDDIFGEVDHIKIRPKPVPENFIREFSGDSEALCKRVINYGYEQREPIDITIASIYNFQKKDSPTPIYIILLTPTYYNLKNNKFVEVSESKIRVQGSQDDLKFLAIKGCYEFVKFVKTRKENILTANNETKMWGKLLNKFTDFLMLQGKENYENLLSEIKQALKKPDSLAEDTVEAFLNSYQPDSKLSDNDNEEKMRKTVEARFK